MVPNNSPDYLKDQLERRIDFLELCLSSNNPGPIHALIAQDVTEIGRNGDLSQPLRAQIVQGGFVFADELSKEFQNALGAFERQLAHEPTNQEAGKALNTLDDDVKEKVGKVLRNSKREGINLISSAEERFRHDAAVLFKGVLSAIAELFTRQQSAIEHLRDTLYTKDVQNIHLAVNNAAKNNKASTEATQKYLGRLGGVQTFAAVKRAHPGEGPLGLWQRKVFADAAIEAINRLGKGFSQGIEILARDEISFQDFRVKHNQLGCRLFSDLEKNLTQYLNQIPQESIQTAFDLYFWIIRRFETFWIHQMDAALTYAESGDFDQAVASGREEAERATDSINTHTGILVDKKITKVDRLTVRKTKDGWEICELVE